MCLKLQSVKTEDKMNSSPDAADDHFFIFRIRLPLLILLCIFVQPVLNVFLVILGLTFFVLPIICGACMFLGLGGINESSQNRSSYDSLTTQQQTRLDENRYNAIKHLLVDCSTVSWVNFCIKVRYDRSNC